MGLNDQAEQLLDMQIREWPLAAANYAALSRVETKRLSVNGYAFTVCFNPARIVSSSAKVDAQTIRERPCFLCRHRLPPEQETLPYIAQSGNEYLILCNPFPIFPRHLTIPDCHHTGQSIWGRMADMLELAEQLSDFILFYNGPQCGASAPDHFHFQAGNKGFLPIQVLLESGVPITGYPTPVFVFASREAHAVAASFYRFFAAFQALASQVPEPMLNLLCWKTGDHYYVVVFPRKRHRPAQFFAEGDAHILLSPAAIDLGGALITPLEKDFRRLSAADISDILAQVSITQEAFTQLANQINK